jgi:MFS transporter, DHA2 family, multidrug resistance protein
VALNEISGSVGATTQEISWVVTSYAISNVIIIPLTSMLSDLFGRRNYFTVSVIIFTFSSLMCGMSDSLTTLILWRFIQGLGGGALLSTAQTIIIGAFPPEKISIGNAIFGMGVILGPTFGPTLGGYITENITWHWIFFINVPIGILAAILSWNFITDRPGATKPSKIDWAGIGFLVMAIGSLQFVLEEGSIKDWFESEEIILFTVVAVAGLVLFIWRELSIDYPAVNIRLYKNSNLAIGGLLNLMIGMILFSTVFIFPLFTQVLLGWTATKTGTFLIPGALCSAFSMPIVGNLLAKGTNPKKIMLVGLIITCLFVTMMSFSSLDSSSNNFLLPFCLRGFGIAFMMSPVLSLAVRGLQGKDLAQGVGLSNMIRQLGGAIGIALLNVYITHQTSVNRTELVGYINQYDVQASERIQGMAQNFMSRGYSTEEATNLAYASINGAVSKQQLLLSYNQGFALLAFCLVLAAPLIFLIRYNKGEKTAAVSDH